MGTACPPHGDTGTSLREPPRSCSLAHSPGLLQSPQLGSSPRSPSCPSPSAFLCAESLKPNPSCCFWGGGSGRPSCCCCCCFQAAGKAKAPKAPCTESVEIGQAEGWGRLVCALCSVPGGSGQREQRLEAPGTPCPALWHTASPGSAQPGPCRSVSSSQKSQGGEAPLPLLPHKPQAPTALKVWGPLVLPALRHGLCPPGSPPHSPGSL